MQPGYELAQEEGLQHGKSITQSLKIKYLLKFWSFLAEEEKIFRSFVIPTSGSNNHLLEKHLIVKLPPANIRYFH